MELLSRILLITALASIQATAQLPTLYLAQEADAVLIGESTATADRGAAVEFGVRASLVLKGDVPIGSSVDAILPKPETDSGVFSGLLLPTYAPRPETYGLWFLRQLDDGKYSGIPSEEGAGLTNYVKTLFIELPRSWAPRSGTSVERLLLDATVECYRNSLDEAFAHTTTAESARSRLIRSLQHAGRFESSREAAFAVLEELLRSPSVEESDIGLIAGVRMSYDPALAHLEANLDSTRLRQRTIGEVFFEMETQYDPSSAKGMARIESLILRNREVQVPGLDDALAKSLRKIRSGERNSVSRGSLPLAALLLDSSDPEAVRRAAHQFYVYTMLSKDDGDGGKSFVHEGIRSHNGLDKNLSAQEQAAFWREWWTRANAKSR